MSEQEIVVLVFWGLAVLALIAWMIESSRRTQTQYRLEQALVDLHQERLRVDMARRERDDYSARHADALQSLSLEYDARREAEEDRDAYKSYFEQVCEDRDAYDDRLQRCEAAYDQLIERNRVLEGTIDQIRDLT